tara:strand:+ start:2570 stop:3190 length:621 start_codon:yes stop_codon:yes gene_type:complete
MLYLLSYVAGEKLITHNDQEIVKVGFSDTWNTRLQAYKSKLPLPVRVYGTTDGTYTEEQEIHRSLTPHRASGEWYYYTEDLMGSLSSIFPIEPYEVTRRRQGKGTGHGAQKAQQPKSPSRFVSEALVKTLRSLPDYEWYSVKTDIHTIFVSNFEGTDPPSYTVINAKIAEAFSKKTGPIWRTIIEVKLVKERQKGRGVCLKKSLES